MPRPFQMSTAGSPPDNMFESAFGNLSIRSQEEDGHGHRKGAQSQQDPNVASNRQNKHSGNELCTKEYLVFGEVRVADKEDEGCGNEDELCKRQEQEGGHAVPGSLDGQRQPQLVPCKIQRPRQVSQQDCQEGCEQEPGPSCGPDRTAQYLQMSMARLEIVWDMTSEHFVAFRLGERKWGRDSLSWGCATSNNHGRSVNRMARKAASRSLAPAVALTAQLSICR